MLGVGGVEDDGLCDLSLEGETAERGVVALAGQRPRHPVLTVLVGPSLVGEQEAQQREDRVLAVVVTVEPAASLLLALLPAHSGGQHVGDGVDDVGVQHSLVMTLAALVAAGVLGHAVLTGVDCVAATEHQTQILRQNVTFLYIGWWGVRRDW